MPQPRSTVLETTPPPAVPQTEPQPRRTGAAVREQAVYVIVVNYRRPELTARAVESALASRGVEVRALVIDNDSQGDLLFSQGLCDERVAVIRNPENVGFGAACNQGIKRALGAGDCGGVLLLNNDATLEPECLAMLRTSAAEYGLAAPKILLLDGRIYSAGGIVELGKGRCRNRGIYEDDKGQYDEPATLQFASACVLYIGAAALRTDIRFHEPYFLYYEDADLCLQLAAEGYEVQYVPHARATHLESASSAGPEREAMLAYYNTRNRLLLLRRQSNGLQRLRAEAYLHAMARVRMLRASGAEAEAMRQALRDAKAGKFGPRE